MDMPRIGQKIKNIREWRNFTQTHMATQLGVKQNTYSLWESGKGLTTERVEAIAHVLDVPAEELNSPDPVSLILTNNHGNNGYVNIHNQQQHTVPMEIVERLMAENKERARMLEDLLKTQLEVLRGLVESTSGKKR
jgi:transcriptional regulator with XRE-family HTH domain